MEPFPQCCHAHRIQYRFSSRGWPAIVLDRMDLESLVHNGVLDLGAVHFISAIRARWNFKKTIAARRNSMSRDSNRPCVSNYSPESRRVADSDTCRGSGETASSWVTVNSDGIEGSSISNNSSSSHGGARVEEISAHFARGLAIIQAVILIGGLGLGIAFLALDILHPKARGLSLYHSFALRMSLVPVSIATAWKALKYVSKHLWRWGLARYEAKKSASRRRRQDSPMSHSERNSEIASDGAV